MPLPRMPLSRDARLLEYLSLLRYGTTDRYHARAPLLNYTTIAKVVKLKASTCAYLLKQYRKSLAHTKSSCTPFTQAESQASAQTVSRGQVLIFDPPKALKKHCIKFKTIQKVKKQIDFTDQVYRDLFKTMISQLNEVKQQGIPLVFLDEAIFSFNTFKAKAWAKSYKSIVIKDQAIKVKTQAFIAAVSLE